MKLEVGYYYIDDKTTIYVKNIEFKNIDIFVPSEYIISKIIKKINNKKKIKIMDIIIK